MTLSMENAFAILNLDVLQWVLEPMRPKKREYFI